MSLAQIVEAIGEHEKELTVINCEAGERVATDLREYFHTQNVRVRTETTASFAPTDIAVLANSDTVLSIVTVSTLQGLLADLPPGADDIGIADGDYEPILGHLKETTFTSRDAEQMLYASREIEDRARRVGDGTIHAGFQRLGILAEQRSIYADLAAHGLDVHAYGVPDTQAPDIGNGVVHAIENDEIAETWFVVFDGAGQDIQKCALLAEERDEGTFYGAWTYDAAIVDSILDHLESTYVAADHTRPRSDT